MMSTNLVTYLHGIITVTRDQPNRWVAALENGLWVESSWSADDAAGKLIRTYPTAVAEYAAIYLQRRST